MTASVLKMPTCYASHAANAAATPEEWAEFVGVPHDTPRHTNFIIFADPRFAQISDIVEGLDYAFPNSPKIGK